MIGLVKKAVVCFLVATGWPMAPRAAPQVVYKSHTDVVSVSVSVRLAGNPVSGLRAADLRLTDNGVPQEIELVDAEQVPIDLTLVLTGGAPDRVVQRELERAIETANAAGRLVRSGDRLRIVTAHADVRGGADDAPLASLLARNDTLGGNALTDALFFALSRPVPFDRRHLVVAFTDGWDTWSFVDTEMLVPLVQQSDGMLSAAIWNGPTSGVTSGGGLGVYGNAASSQRDRERSFQTLQRAVESSGGIVLDANKGAVSALQTLLREQREGYVLRYSPRGVPSPGWHAISVGLRQPSKATVRARRGYSQPAR